MHGQDRPTLGAAVAVSATWRPGKSKQITSEIDGDAYDAKNAKDDQNNGDSEQNSTKASVEFPLVVSSQAVLSWP